MTLCVVATWNNSGTSLVCHVNVLSLFHKYKYQTPYKFLRIKKLFYILKLDLLTSFFFPLPPNFLQPPPFSPHSNGCPIRPTFRPILANHTISKPAGGVKKVTGVGGTTYEISVWLTLLRGRGKMLNGCGLLGSHPSWKITKNWGPWRETFLLDWSQVASLCGTPVVLFKRHEPTLPASPFWTKTNWGHWSFHLTTLWAIDWYDCVNTAGYRYVEKTCIFFVFFGIWAFFRRAFNSWEKDLTLF